MTMYVLFYREQYEDATLLLAVSPSAEKLEARKEYLAEMARKPRSEIPEDLWCFQGVRAEELFIQPVEVL